MKIVVMLTDEKFPDGVTTGYENPVERLFVPMLRQASSYDVAVGYFTSGWLRDTAEGLAEFAIRGGTSRWIISPCLNRADADAIVSTVPEDSKIEVLRERQLMDMISALKCDSRAELCALIAARVIEFRIAEPKDEGKQGMLHAKIGIATDESQNAIGFSGSYNMTANAKFNWENIEIFRSWEGNEASRIDRLERRFSSLWTNKDPGYETYEPSESLIECIRNEAGPAFDEFILKRKRSERNQPEFRDYQLAAIKAWGENNGRGTYVMATGSGKTITALGTISKLIDKVVHERERPLVIVIILPLKHLLEQWHREAIGFGLDSLKCYENSITWRQKLAERISTLDVTKEGYVVALVTNATFATEHFQGIIGNIEMDFMIIADEAHNLGSSTYLGLLPENANFRLALSATPERHNDTYGTRGLFEYFGHGVIDFGLKDAIDAGYLCPYNYYAHLCPMTEVEYEEYQTISEEISTENAKKRAGSGKSKELLRLEGKRTDLITRVESKLEKLKQLMIKQQGDGGVSHTLVYCGSRRGEDSERHIERTVKLVGSLDVKVRKFTAAESMDDRKEILKLFASGELEAIAAIKCLDEGVDVPQTRVAYILASTRNPREYVQRRGRVLRKSPGKKYAEIHDFLICPPPSRAGKSDLLDREIERATEFADLALNKQECNDGILALTSEMEK
jgi:superfamily II DNA or RNA helicase